ncbi:Cutinase [Pyrenophora tritici-repentis]|nr:Cutinase [Pyrenophora tritici-repentis]
MKYHAAQALSLASIASAFPHPQLPTFTLPNGGLVGFSLPTNLPGLGGGFSLPTSLPGLGGLGGGSSSGGSSLSGLLSGLFGGLEGGLSGGGLGGGLGGGSSTTTADAISPIATPTKTIAPISAPIATGGAGAGTNSTTPTTPAPVTNPNCKPQSGTASPFGGSENGVKENACCTDMTVIFARGTGEMGNVGTVSGPPMFKAIRVKLGNDRVTVQGVDYAASAAGNINLGGDGGQKMADLVQLAKKQCPSTKIILSGYSQGAMVVHNAFSKGVSAGDVAGAVLFGDPLKRQAIS